MRFIFYCDCLEGDFGSVIVLQGWLFFHNSFLYCNLGVSCMEEALAIRSVIKEKRAAFGKEFKLFDEHIWKHFQINGQVFSNFCFQIFVKFWLQF